MTETEAAAAAPRRGVRRVTLLVAIMLTALVVGVAAFSVGRLSTLVDPRPSDTSAEAGFARDMQTHHNQGVELALIIRDRTDDEAVRRLAYDITVTQGQQSGQMYAWLVLWDLSQAGAEPSMTWMTRPAPTDSGSDSGHAHDTEHVAGEPMPGLATSEQIASLTAASGIDAEREFLTLMIAHHQGAVEMAEAVLDRSDNSTVRGFANAVVLSQKSEIDLMTGMLEDRS
ncbi:DUF305 domain-containing protein [Cryobacterium melibiosiphilum]|uniref:DUF305 domain-containing protein n=1 Tax=Cryobacterium melibiosiphilum TaxID=995039 RepID=A0A3A5ML95_9MICO|nr:DUF305 domain-containing protein [Cryobacterium melibiosiphilum]RJT85237.1 DUF305 domain-containing protein [Cryobacterium melibiosiphilum]